jgi:hypothetical protein
LDNSLKLDRHKYFLQIRRYIKIIDSLLKVVFYIVTLKFIGCSFCFTLSKIGISGGPSPPEVVGDERTD